MHVDYVDQGIRKALVDKALNIQYINTQVVLPYPSIPYTLYLYTLYIYTPLFLGAFPANKFNNFNEIIIEE